MPRLLDIGALYLYLLYFSMASLLFGAWAAFALGLGSLPLASAQIQGLSLKRDKLLKVVAEVNPPAAGQKSACCFSCSVPTCVGSLVGSCNVRLFRFWTFQTASRHFVGRSSTISTATARKPGASATRQTGRTGKQAGQSSSASMGKTIRGEDLGSRTPSCATT